VPARFLRLNLPAGSPVPQRSPLIERLLADARPERTADWRGDAWAQLAPGSPLPLLAPARLAARGVRAEGFALLASPVHYVAGLSNVRLPAGGLLRFSEVEARQLADDFSAVWRNAPMRLVATGDVLCCVFDGHLQVVTHDPQRALGRHVDAFTPTGKDAARLRALGSEVEMWLFDHALNRARAERGEPVVNGLWLWGGGEAPISLPTPGGGTYGDDVLFELFKRARADEAQLWVTDAVPGSEAWGAVETGWLAPAAMALRQGRAQSLTLSSGDRLWHVRAGWRLRFWRRTVPWWQSLDDATDD
jgi:hypothetical protein